MVCKRAQDLELPLVVDELWAFGSAIRAKEAPGDVDLVAKYSKFHPAFDIFKVACHDMVRRYGWSDDQPDSPSIALAEFLKSIPDNIQNTALFLSWIEGISWSVIFRDICPDMFGYDASGLTKRILLRSARGIHIMQTVPVGEKGWVAAKAYQLIWSKSRPDLYENLKTVLSSETVRETCILEYRNFETQMHPLAAKVKVLHVMLPLLMHHDGPFRNYEDCNKWLIENAAVNFPEYGHEMLERIFKYDDLSQENVPGITQLDISPDEAIEVLKARVEERRKEVKATHELNLVIGRALWFVKDGKSRMAYKGKELEEFVAERTIEDVPKRNVPEERIREILRSLGLPEDRIEAVRGYGKVLYRVQKANGDNGKKDF